LTLAAADQPASSGDQPPVVPAAPSSSSNTTISLDAKGPAPPVVRISRTSLTDPIATSPVATSDDPFADLPSAMNASRTTSASAAVTPVGNPAKSNGQDTKTKPVVPLTKSATLSPATKGPKLIHADYAAPVGKSERKQIRTVAGDDTSPFDDPAEEGTAAAAPSKFTTRPAAVPRALHAEATKKMPAAPANPPAAATIDASQPPAIAVQWIKKSPLSVGQECACDLLVKNLGKVAVKDVGIYGYFPTSVRLTGAEPMPVDNQDHVTWTFPSLAPGDERLIHIKMVPSKRGELSPMALVRFTEIASTVFVVEEPMLNVSMRGPKELMVGDPATQSITVSNPGTGVVHSVLVEARVTKGLENPRGEKLRMEVGSLNPGESRLVRLPLVAVAGGEQEVLIRATGGNDLRQDLATKINVIAPSVKVALEGPSLRYVGRKATYVITATNDGGGPSNNVRVCHKLPEGFKFLRADKGGEYDETSRTVNWFIGHMETKESLQLRLEASTLQIGSHLQTVAAITEQGTRSEAKFETVVDGTASLEVEIVDQNDPVEVGAETAYEIHVRNDGSKAAQNVGLACELPAAMELLRAEGASEGQHEKGHVTFRPLATLEPGKTAIFRVYVRGRTEGSHRFRARLTSDSVKEPLMYEEMTKFYAE
jgi:uncharacterized repeat protein (TIGR01451 family)